MSTRGRFVVLEGIDGSGTTTQAARLADRLREEGGAVRLTREPSDGPVGTLVRQILTGRIVSPGNVAPAWTTMALLFAADRMDHAESEILPFLELGGTVISDRYDASSLAYQSAMSGANAPAAVDWIRILNRHAPRPDLTIVLDVSAEAAAVRIAKRGETAQLYEQNEFQRALVSFYRDLPAHVPSDRVVVVDGSGSLDAVHTRVFAAFSEAFSAREG